MNNNILLVGSIVFMLAMIELSGCSAMDASLVPNAKRDVKRVDDSRFPVVFIVDFKVQNLEERWWKDSQRTVSAYLEKNHLIPESCKGGVEILNSGGTENTSLGWARFRCKSS